MLSKWLERLRGGSGSGSSTTEAPEPVTAPEPPSMPAEPPAAAGMGEEDTSEPAGDEPA
jgi:hypothetical protein